jgi:hypothetical protein
MSEAKLEATTVQGFPVVSANQDRTLLGYIGRTELTYLLGALCSPLVRSSFLTSDIDKARLARTLSPGTICSFVESHDDVPRTRRPNTNRFTVSPASPVSAQSEDHADTDTLLAPSWSASGGLGIDEVDEDVELELIGETGGRGGLDGDVLRLGPWVNQVCSGIMCTFPSHG